VVKQAKFSADESSEWLQMRLEKLGIDSLSEFADLTGINKGTVSKYFRQLQRPSIEVLPILCEKLKVSPSTLLQVLGVLPK
jgi:transcriptional regulator with XRE-family HTH domain